MVSVRLVVALVLAVNVDAVSGCSEEAAPIDALDARVAQGLVAAVSERFSMLGPQLERALPLRRAKFGIVPMLPAPVARGTGAPTGGLGSGGWLPAGNHLIKATLPERASGETRLTSGPVTIEVRAVRAAPAPGVISDLALVYKDVYPHADSLVLAEEERIEEFIVLHNERAPRRFEYELKVLQPGCLVRQIVPGQMVEVLDRNGNAWLRLQRPWLIDARGEKHDLESRLENGRLVLVLPARAKAYPMLLDPGWITTGSMTAARVRHTATLLGTGKVLVAGGIDGSSNVLASAELYDPATGTWTTTSSMSQPRDLHCATLLTSGAVLVAGGKGATGALSSSELYDPVKGSWTTTGSLATSRSSHTAIQLSTGLVLITGGKGAAGALSSSELYNPATGIWTATGSLATGRSSHAMALFSSGKILAVGGEGATGVLSSAELYDPVTGTWTATGNLATGRSSHAMALFSSGKILAVGGEGATGVLSSAELYDPVTGTWTATGNLSTGRSFFTATPLSTGDVLIAGGKPNGLLGAEIFDHTTYTWSSTASMKQGRWGHTATLLGTGAILVAGGRSGPSATVKSSELFIITLGLSCTSPSACVSGFCVDGVCCGSSCTATCMNCGLSGSLGTCTWVPAGQVDAAAVVPCVGTQTCDGTGSCKLALGQSCIVGNQCATGHCADAVCCDSACTENCKSCGMTGSLGTCAWVPAGLPDASSVVPCVGNLACDGKGSCKQISGQTCKLPTECYSGFCADGVCCNSSCTYTCMSCSIAGKIGSCAYLPAGMQDLATCTGQKACNGAGGCGLINGKSCSTGAACASGLCAPDGVCCDTACTETCKSCVLPGLQGKCSLVPSGQEDPLATIPCIGPCKQCNLPGNPVGTCSPVPLGKPDLNTSTPCTGPKACDGAGACKLAQGQSCNPLFPTACATGYCTDTVCCAEACDATCMTCDLPGGVPGICSYVPAGQADAQAAQQCTGSWACDGSGGCKNTKAKSCSKTDDCPNKLCVDGYCCYSICSEKCKTCGLAGKEGFCVFVPAGKPDSYPASICSGDHVCDGKGGCLQANGQACAKPTDCGSGYCVDGYCCDSECKESCMSCKIAKKLGTCTPQPSQSDPDKDCIGKDADCGGRCDGAGKCDFPAVGTTCSSKPCQACDGTGGCTATPADDSDCGVIDCDKLDTACKDFTDLTTARCASFGQCKKDNDSKTCTTFSDLPCGDAGGDGAPKKVVDPPTAKASSSGCQMAGSFEDDGPLFFTVLLLVIMLGRSRFGTGYGRQVRFKRR